MDFPDHPRCSSRLTKTRKGLFLGADVPALVTVKSARIKTESEWHRKPNQVPINSEDSSPILARCKPWHCHTMVLLFPLSHFKFILRYGSQRGCQAEPEMHMFLVNTTLYRGPPSKNVFFSVLFVILRHTCHSLGCGRTLLNVAAYNPNTKNKYRYLFWSSSSPS